MKERERRLELGRALVVQLRQLQVTGIEVQISQVVMSLYVTRFVLQSQCEAVEGLRHPAFLEFDDAEVAIGIGEVVSFGYRFPV